MPDSYDGLWQRHMTVGWPAREVFLSGSFGSERTWYVGLDNFDNRDSQRMGAVKVSAACAPSENPRSKGAERAARQRVKLLYGDT